MQKVNRPTPNKRKLFRLIGWVVQTCLVLLLLKATVLSAAEPEEVTFPSGKLVLHGFLYRPLGNGPFPAILYNHGSEQNPSWKPALGEFFSSRGYVFFVPHRRGHGRSLHDFFVKSLRAQGAGGSHRAARDTSRRSVGGSRLSHAAVRR